MLYRVRTLEFTSCTIISVLGRFYTYDVTYFINARMLRGEMSRAAKQAQ